MVSNEEYTKIVKSLVLSSIVLFSLLVLIQFALYKKVPFEYCGGELGNNSCPMVSYCREVNDADILADGFCVPYMTPVFDAFYGG